MTLRHAGIAVVVVVTLAGTIGFASETRSPGATVHEWGTFTTVAGVDGNSTDWLPLGGPTDLPCFVKHVRMAAPAPLTVTSLSDTGRPRTVTASSPFAIERLTDTGKRRIIATNTFPVYKGEVIAGLVRIPATANTPVTTGTPLTYEQARQSLWGKVRMETPVIYFYSADAYDARVTVRFPQGVITEFYPTPEDETAPFGTMTLRNAQHVHTMNWNVSVAPRQPEVYPNGGESSHYYAARATDATPLRVGTESEKFIFYRGVANFDVPVKALVAGGDSVLVVNGLAKGALPAVILFENRNGRMGFRSIGALDTHVTLAKPKLTSNVAQIRAALHKALVRAGLYEKEATAMLDTWNDSWFEEGSRVFYLLPRETVDAVLPLQVTPAPAAVSRVFIGRVELIDRATTTTVRAALEANDMATLGRYARFLNPITDRIIAAGVDFATANRISAVANTAYAKYNKDSRVCGN